MPTIVYGDFYINRNGKAGFSGAPKRFLTKSAANRRIALNKAKDQLRLLAEEQAAFEEKQAAFEGDCKDFIEFFTCWMKRVEAEDVV